MRAALALALALSACSAPEPVTMSTTLDCHTRVRCDVLTWQLGTKFGPNLSGLHGSCRCVD
jgi:hypothetical protein